MPVISRRTLPKYKSIPEDEYKRKTNPVGMPCDEAYDDNMSIVRRFSTPSGAIHGEYVFSLEKFVRTHLMKLGNTTAFWYPVPTSDATCPTPKLDCAAASYGKPLRHFVSTREVDAFAVTTHALSP